MTTPNAYELAKEYAKLSLLQSPPSEQEAERLAAILEAALADDLLSFLIGEIDNLIISHQPKSEQSINDVLVRLAYQASKQQRDDLYRRLAQWLLTHRE